MRIGIISDTHDRQRRVEAAVERFNRADLDLVLHAGDYVSPFVVPWLAALSAPLVGVSATTTATARSSPSASPSTTTSISAATSRGSRPTGR